MSAICGGRGLARSTAIPTPVLFRSRVALAIALATSSIVAADPKRDVPDYDGRGNPDTDSGSWALWIPRVALSPLYVVNELVLRRSLGALVTTAERHHWVNSIADLFTFGARGNFVIT